MIIDIILDRKANTNLYNKDHRIYSTPEYNAKRFYNQVMGYYESMPEIVQPIADALDSGTEQDVKNTLTNYIIKNNYPQNLITFINANNWI